MKLFKRYGYCVIPEGTILIRSGLDYEYPGCMFFGLDALVGCYSRQNNEAPQVWRTKKNFEVLFMVDHVTSVPCVISSIVDIYTMYYPVEDVDGLDIKQRDLTKRNKLFDILKKDGISGWLSSLENMYPLEICLFPNREVFELLIGPVQEFDMSDYDYHNALNDISIYPSEEFYRKSSAYCEDFNGYKKRFSLRWENEKPEDLLLSKKRHLNLRLKLGI